MVGTRQPSRILVFCLARLRPFRLARKHESTQKRFVASCKHESTNDGSSAIARGSRNPGGLISPLVWQPTYVEARINARAILALIPGANFARGTITCILVFCLARIRSFSLARKHERTKYPLDNALGNGARKLELPSPNPVPRVAAAPPADSTRHFHRPFVLSSFRASCEHKASVARAKIGRGLTAENFVSLRRLLARRHENHRLTYTSKLRSRTVFGAVVRQHPQIQQRLQNPEQRSFQMDRPTVPQ
jgi:hypothetical protein